MPKFIMTYHMGTNPPSPEEGQAQMAKWKEWMQANSAALLEPQNPIGKTVTVTSDGTNEGSNHPTIGYSILEAEDMDAALIIAQSCPFLDMGTLEISQLMQMG